MLARSVLVWVGLVALAILNGAFREAILTPWLGAYAGHVLSTLILCTLILLLTAATIGWIGPNDSRAAWTVGLAWLALTVAFEFLAGHYVFGTPWSTLMADYDILKGRVWVLVLLTTATAPALAAQWRQVPR